MNALLMVPDGLAFMWGGVVAGLGISAYAVVRICVDERRAGRRWGK